MSSPRRQARVVSEDAQSGGRYFRHTIPIGPTAPALAREALTHLEDLSNSTTRYHAQLLVSDLISHRIGGAQAGPPGGTVDLAISVTPQRLRVELSEGDRKAPRVRPGAAKPTLGWELQLVGQLADRWGVRNDGVNMVWFELER
jgi:hypothetical protein